jgi:energy-coupling factor transport system substrate-specific component
MREVVTMWRDSRMIVLTVVVTATYTAVLIPFKGVVLVPGFTELRFANVLPVVFSLLFGPAAAWGAAFGNLIADVFGGTLTRGSLFGFVGNFFFGFAGYKLWGNLGRLSSMEAPSMQSAEQVVEFLVIAAASAAGTAAIIAWGLNLLGLAPFSVIGTIIAVNNFVVVATLGPPLLHVLYPRVERDGLLYLDLMDGRDDPTVNARRQRRAGIAIVGISIAWLLLGIAISVFVEDVPLGTTPGDLSGPYTGTHLQVMVGAVGFLLLLTVCLRAGERPAALTRRWAPGDE